MNPVSAIFGAGVALRNAFYDRRWLKVNKLSRPVVSIGNISVGGSGKTPFVIALGELLQQRGISFDVLSRGYRRKSRAVAIVDPLGSAEEFGDEPLLIARKLQVPVVVGADRYEAGLLAERTFQSQLHLLDDGFQHRGLHRDFDIVMLPGSDLEDTLLPMGRLRESISSLRRADVLVIECAATPADFGGAVWRVQRELQLDHTEKLPAIVFCGVARPRRFFSEVEALLGARGVVEQVAFPDHHRYRVPDVERLLRIKTQSGAACFITTEKDQINLANLAERLQPLTFARLRLQLADPGSAFEQLLRTLQQRCGLHI
ncbi:MAG TPA: tetraacyldisaccharide 4'-kinase [Terriglobales bacterium]|nr:tetraacyldisaccharide 4'-kinase [Terriglobales bacterium]